MSSTKLEKLTEPQEALMEPIKNEWLNRAFSGFSFNKDDAQEGIEWIYSLCGLPAPKFIFISSPLGAQLTANLLKKGLPEQVESQVWSQVGSQVGSQVRSQVESQVRSQVQNEKLENFSFAYVGWNYFGWAAWAQFFKDIGIELSDKLTPFLKFLRSNCFDFIPFNGLCIVCEPPKKVARDELFRLSSEEGPCIEWNDGYKLWALNGVFFEFELWDKILKKELTAREILAIENMEQRMIALKFAGAEHTLEAMGAKLVDKSDRGNELYLVEKFFEEDPKAYFLKYACPSTGRVYLSGIDPTFAKGKKADECMAWKHKITLPEYNKLRFES